jgi:glutamine amidotransferase
VTPEIVVVDYDRGNLFSVCQAVAKVGGRPRLSSSPAEVVAADHVILPGVGAFGDAMARLRAAGLDAALRSFAATGRPLLGICLGMELLLDESSEFGRHEGLGLIPGTVSRLPAPVAPRGEKIPNVGWCRLLPVVDGVAWPDSLFHGVKPGAYAYFVHSFAAFPRERAHRLADIAFGGREVAAAVASGAVTGCQFHPEKSGEVGLAILDAFVRSAA